MRLPPPPSTAAPTAFAGASAFESYYRKQQIVPEEEWPAFVAALQAPLPLDVRVSARAPLAERAFERLVPLLRTEARPLQWAGPDVWQFERPTAAAEQLQRATEDGYHRFLHRQQKRGALHRQESASMLPALLLAPRPQHKVLDMCAARVARVVLTRA